LPLDAMQCAFRNVALGMHNGDAAGLCRMLELNLTAFLRGFVPAIGSKSGNDVTAVHQCV
jgi:hypothetical protein